MRQSQTEWSRARRFESLHCVCVCQWLPILVWGSVMRCTAMSKAREDRLVEPLLLVPGLEVIGSCRQVFDSQARGTSGKDLQTKRGPVSVRGYVGIPYRRTQLSENMVPMLFYVLVVTGKALVIFMSRPVQTISC